MKKQEKAFYAQTPVSVADCPIQVRRIEALRENMFHTEMHWHQELELIYIFSGEVRLVCGLKEAEGKAGDLWVIYPEEAHYLDIRSDYASYGSALIPMDFLRQGWFDIPEGKQFALCVQDDAQVKGLAESLISEADDINPGRSATICGLATQLIACLIRRHLWEESERSAGGRKVQMVMEAISYMEEHYMEEITVDSICAHIGFSKFYFCRTFREITGKTAVEHLNIIRCQKAYQRIAYEKRSIREAAELSGFHNQQYFCKVYKKYSGQLPSRIRKERAS
ncbi:MAG: AraC family transcriptional regulator [Oscillospiraceae bacterium]|jgi:AraC-like DNA-binding protein|nr:AraC family transcriptional regulator [Oscillospiraceae bacterium]